MTAIFKNVPYELRELNNWVCWQRHPERGKIPITPDTGRWAESSNAGTWRSFKTALEHHEKYDGLGFMFTPPYIGIDLDHCYINDTLSPLAQEILSTLSSYTEFSPSKTGTHTIVKGVLPKSYKKDGIEIYNKARFFTITGDIIKSYPKLIAKANGHLEGIVTKHFGGAGGLYSNPKGWVKDKLSNIKPGTICNDSVSLIGKLHRDGWEPGDIEELLRPHITKAEGDEHALKQRISSITSYPRTPNRPQGPAFTRFSQDVAEGLAGTPVELISSSTYTEEYKRRLTSRSAHPNIALPTGLPSLDRHTRGLKKGGLWIVAARTGIGKTSFVTAICSHLLRENKRVLFFSTEMSRDDVYDRFVSCGTGVPYFDIEAGKVNGEDREKIEKYLGQLEQENLHICDEAEPAVGRVNEAILRVRPDVLVFDHIQRVSHGGNQRYLEISSFVKSLNSICRDNGCAGIVNSQLNRLAEFEPPSLHHLKECGALEEEAHAVVLLSPVTNNPGETEQIVQVDLGKNRSGPKGQFQVRFQKPSSQFQEEI